MRIIAGTYKGRTIRTGKGPGYRPATGRVREALFSMLQARGVSWPGMRVLDLFAGSGSLGLEALSRGAEFVLLLENAPEAAGLIERTAMDWGVDQQRYRVLAQDLFSVCRKRPESPFGLAFIDPPYGKGLLDKALGLALRNGWLSPGAVVCAEVEADAEIAGQPGLELETDRLYGQTRIILWRNQS